MPIIELPDGREVEFPDSMDNAAISSAIHQNFPEFAPKKSLAERAGDSLRNAPDPLRAKLDAEKRDSLSVMERVEGQPLDAPAAAAPAGAPVGLFADLKGRDVLPAATARAQETRDIIDPSAAARTRRLIGQGMNVEQAQSVGKRAATAGVLPGQEGGTSRMEATGFDFATRKKFNEDPFFKNPAVRGAVKGYEGYKQGLRGINQFAAEALGADETAGMLAQNAAKSRDFTDAMGTPTDHLSHNFEGAVSSIATQLPALIGGAVTGSEALALGSMFAQTFGTEYTDGRARGQDIGDATQRAGLMASFEVVGERIGLGRQLDIIRNSARGVETNALAKFLANTAKNELPGESVTTTGQFLTDKLGGGIGLNTEAGFADYLSQMGDTVTQTIMQGGIMGTATGGVNAGMHGLRNGDHLRNAEAGADAARSEALGKWRTQGLTARPAPAIPASPAAPERREPTLAAVTGAASVDDAIRAADDLVHADPIHSPHATAADIDALEQAALAQVTTGGTANATDAALSPNVPAGTGGRDQLVAGIGSDNAGPVEVAGLAPGPESGAAGIAGAGGEPDRVRAGAGADAQPALTPQRDAIDAIVDHDTDWHEFPAETGTLNVPRAQMPQIKAEHRGALTQFLKARGITHEQIEVPAEDLKPTQAEFSLAKVQKAMDFEGGDRSILVSSDGHVLDGHHQWMAALDAGQPVKAIRLNAPIAQLLDQVKEFPSTGVAEGAPSQEATANVSERPQVPEETQAENGAQGAPQTAAGKPGTKLDAARAKHQRQDDAVAQAAANIAARKKVGGGQRARERVKMANPFLGFLASHGVHMDDRSDTGGEKGRKGGVMVPGYGPLYRRTGKRLDELATLAQEAGFLTAQDIEDATDTGGTRKLADMIQRAVQGKEVIREAGSIDAAMPDADARLVAEAQSLGIETDGKSADALYDEVAVAHDEHEARRERVGSASVDEQVQVERIADDLEQLARDADIPLGGGTSSDNLTDEDIDAIFGLQTAGARTTGGQAEKTSNAPAPQGAGRAARADEDLLSSYTPSEIRALQDADDARARAKQAERDKLDATRKKERDAADVQSRMDASADNFTLGQSADDALAGQQDIFSAAPAAETDPAHDDGADIPRAFFKNVKVDHDVWIEDEGVMETTKMRADEALASVNEDIDNLTALLKCMKG